MRTTAWRCGLERTIAGRDAWVWCVAPFLDAYDGFSVNHIHAIGANASADDPDALQDDLLAVLQVKKTDQTALSYHLPRVPS